jgi:hypothetical protein
MGYTITTDTLKAGDIVSQLRAVKEFPTSIRIYDRVFTILNYSEIIVFVNAFEVGFFIGEEFQEQK